MWLTSNLIETFQISRVTQKTFKLSLKQRNFEII